jgi:hypothetical protein
MWSANGPFVAKEPFAGRVHPADRGLLLVVHVHVVFVSHLARSSLTEAAAIAPLVGATEYETRVALATTPPAIIFTTRDRARAEDAVAGIRSRGHGAYVFDDDGIVPTARMKRMDDFRLDPDGIRRTANDDFLPYGDIFAVLRALHEKPIEESRSPDHEPVAYFFRRSGDTPWILRAHHSSFSGLGVERTAIAFTNFVRTLARIRESAPSAVYDDRLVRRTVAPRLTLALPDSPRDGIDLLAHLLAMSIASQGGSPYR